MIHIENLSFSYKKEVLSDISTQFEKGKIYGLLGPNGAGKTTLMKLMCGIMRSKKGGIAIDNESPAKRTPQLLSSIYYLPEHPVASINSIKRFAKEYGWFYPTFSYEEFKKLVTEMRLDINAKFSELSTGESKKVFIAFALALNTPYLLLDEPTNGLDITSKGEFRQIISRYMNDERCIIIATHQVKEVANLLDHIIIIKETKKAIDSSIEELQHNYTFGSSQQLPADAIYSEPSINGYSYITPGKGEESNIDIEMLFNYINTKQ